MFMKFSQFNGDQFNFISVTCEDYLQLCYNGTIVDLIKRLDSQKEETTKYINLNE